MTRATSAPGGVSWVVVGAVASAAAALGWSTAVVAGWQAPLATGRDWSFWFGVAAATLCFSQLLYPLRRRLMAWPFGTAERARRFHLASSLVMFVCVLTHLGARLPAGLMGWALLVTSGATVVTGVAGVVIQRRVPVARLARTAAASPGPVGVSSDGLLRIWLAVHAPAGLALLGLVAWHIFTVAYY